MLLCLSIFRFIRNVITDYIGNGIMENSWETDEEILNIYLITYIFDNDKYMSEVILLYTYNESVDLHFTMKRSKVFVFQSASNIWWW
jgi:hypothetical protein